MVYSFPVSEPSLRSPFSLASQARISTVPQGRIRVLIQPFFLNAPLDHRCWERGSSGVEHKGFPPSTTDGWGFQELPSLLNLAVHTTSLLELPLGRVTGLPLLSQGNGMCRQVLSHTHLQFQHPLVPRIITLLHRSFGNSEFQMALKAAVVDLPGLLQWSTLCCVLRRGTGRQTPAASPRLGGNSTQSSQIPFSALAAPPTIHCHCCHPLRRTDQAPSDNNSYSFKTRSLLHFCIYDQQARAADKPQGKGCGRQAITCGRLPASAAQLLAPAGQREDIG